MNSSAFDIDFFKNVYPLEAYAHELKDRSFFTMTPFEASIREQIHDRERCRLANVTSYRAVYFVAAIGEPVISHATKVGGIPYRPRNLPWPQIPNLSSGEVVSLPNYFLAKEEYFPGILKPCQLQSRPFTFFAQFDFSESQAKQWCTLPGDVLLIFRSPLDEMPAQFFFEWHNLGVQDLCSKEDMPVTFIEGDTEWKSCWHGQRFETDVYTDEQAVAIFSEYSTYGHLHFPRGICIAQYPPWITERPDIDDTFPRHLCTISSIEPDFGLPWSFSNSQQLVTSEDTMDAPFKYSLTIGDMFQDSFFLSKTGVEYHGFTG